MIITPAKDEEQFILFTLNTVCIQAEKRIEWILVDYGSTDNTKSFAEKYTAKHPWINVITSNIRQKKRKGDSKVISVFYRGLDSLTQTDYDCIVKLEADLSLPKNYFEEVSK